MNAMPIREWGDAAFDNAMFAAGFERQTLGMAMVDLFSHLSTMRQDQQEATDFITAGGAYRWASRIRRVESTKRNRDVTIRSQLKSGRSTEIDKLHHTDLYLYAWISDSDQLEEFIVFAVKPFLESGVLETAREIWNYDSKTAFKVVPVYEIQEIPNCLLAGRSSISEPVSYRWTTSNEYIASKDANKPT